ncbi:MAG: efflux RND transporter periplasmic adaptor subunit, partial [Chrysiogenales bacterium]
YTCPMHPQIVKEKPGNCPICGMKLVPLRKDDKSDANGHDGRSMTGLSPVRIDPERQALMGLTFEKAERRDIVREIRTSAKILPDETRQYRVTVKVNGWVEKLYINQTGQFVRRGSPLLTLYSPELLSSQQEYLSSLRAGERLAGMEDGGGLSGSGIQEITKAARDRLRLFDISQAQIDRIGRTGVVERTMVLYSPASGYVMEKNVLPGQKVLGNDTLMTIIDLSRVWGEADVYETDIPYVKTGMNVELTLSYWPAKVFRGRITFLDPVLNPETRTLKARLEIPNADLSLKPNMYGDAKLRYSAGKKISVSEGAVMRTGERDYVFVKKTERGDILPVKVTLGVRDSGGFFEIRDGIKDGDMVVSTANFLVDSESSIRAALKAASAPGGHQH